LFINLSLVTLIYSKSDSLIFTDAIKKAQQLLYKDNDSTTYYLNRALEISKKDKNVENEILTLIKFAKYNVTRGHNEEAFVNCNEARKLSSKKRILTYEIEIKMYTGLILYRMGLYSEGLKLLLEAQRLSSSAKEYNKKSELDYYTAMVYSDIGDLEMGLKYARSSISTSIKKGDTVYAYSSYAFMTDIFQNIDSLQKYFIICEDILSKNPQLLFEKVVFNVNKAMTMIALNDLKQSKTLYLEAMQLSEKGGFDEYLSFVYNNYAYQLMYESSYDSVLYYLDKALNLAVKINNLDAEAETFDSYSDYYGRIGDYKNSLKYSKLYIEKSNEFREKKKLKETRFLSAVYENEKKENAILKQQNEINKLWIYVIIAIVFLVIVIAISIYFRQRWALSKSKLETTEKTKKLEIAEAKIQGQDAERDRLGMDLHDGIVADLSGLKMRIQSYFKENDEFNTVNHSLNTIIQNLRGLSHRMRPASLEEYGLVPSIQNLVYTVNQSNKFKVDFNCDFDDRLSQNIEISIYFLIYELVNNATKYSSGDTIDIQLYKDKELIYLSVEDNGGGFNPENKSAGQGLKNIRDRLAQLGGNLVIDSHDDATAFIINIPIK